jgi:hypothetical protein
MTHELYDPAKEPCSPLFHTDPDCCTICGPGGNTTLRENNEKGILETGVFRVIALHQQAALGSDHDSFKQGIYTTNSMGDND